MKKPDLTGTIQKLTKSKLILPAALALAALLLLLPKSGSEEAAEAETLTEAAASFSLENEEARLEDALTLISGAGKVKALLALESSGERVLAEDEDGIAVISAGSGSEEAVELYTTHARYLGAVIVSEGADNAEVRLNLTKAVASFTGLGSDKITILDMK